MIEKKPAEYLEMAEKRLGSLRAVCAFTGRKKSTLLRIKNGDTERPHPKTLRDLKKAAGV